MSGFPINDERDEYITSENVIFSVKNLFRTRVNDRLLAPGFGTPASVFERRDGVETTTRIVLEQESRLKNAQIDIDDAHASIRFDARLAF